MAKKINFNNPSFNGFEANEDILVDTCVILAYLNEFDAWHSTISKLFDDYIMDESKALFLYINPCILNELAHLTDINKCIENYVKEHTGINISKQMI